MNAKHHNSAPYMIAQCQEGCQGEMQKDLEKFREMEKARLILLI